MDCLPPPAGSRADLHFRRARAAFRAALILCACFLLSVDVLALDAGDIADFALWMRSLTHDENHLRAGTEKGSFLEKCCECAVSGTHCCNFKHKQFHKQEEEVKR